MIERFIEQFADRGFQFAYSLCGNVEDAKELVQEAFYRVIRKWDQYDQTQPLDSWFLAILRNVYYDGLKRCERRQAVSLSGEDVERAAGATPSGEQTVLDRMVREEADAEVRSALAALSPEHRAVIDLADIQGMSYEEISAVLDCPSGTVRSRLCRARAALKKELLSRDAEVRR